MSAAARLKLGRNRTSQSHPASQDAVPRPGSREAQEIELAIKMSLQQASCDPVRTSYTFPDGRQPTLDSPGDCIPCSQGTQEEAQQPRNSSKPASQQRVSQLAAAAGAGILVPIADTLSKEHAAEPAGAAVSKAVTAIASQPAVVPKSAEQTRSRRKRQRSSKPKQYVIDSEEEAEQADRDKAESDFEVGDASESSEALSGDFAPDDEESPAKKKAKKISAAVTKSTRKQAAGQPSKPSNGKTKPSRQSDGKTKPSSKSAASKHQTAPDKAAKHSSARSAATARARSDRGKQVAGQSEVLAAATQPAGQPGAKPGSPGAPVAAPAPEHTPEADCQAAAPNCKPSHTAQELPSPMQPPTAVTGTSKPASVGRDVSAKPAAGNKGAAAKGRQQMALGARPENNDPQSGGKFLRGASVFVAGLRRPAKPLHPNIKRQ